VIRAALGASESHETPLMGMLCFVDGDWPLIWGSFTIDGLHVLWPKAAAKQLTRPGFPRCHAERRATTQDQRLKPSLI
jgi:hypothetical protein